MNQSDWQITGHTRLFGIIADPIAQVKTPQGLNPLMRERDVDGVLVPFHVAALELAAFVRMLRGLRNFGGAIVTVPHKTSIVSLCDEVEPLAAAVGAVNCIRRETDGRIVGTILDGRGFVEGLRSQGIGPENRSVFLAGAGGAASAIAFALAEAGIARLGIANRTRARSENLAARLAVAYPQLAVDVAPSSVSGFDLVVNATALGMAAGDPLPIDIAALAADQIVAEIIMTPRTTPLLAAAADRGCRIHYGQPMLDCQLALMADFMGMRA
ncbi:MAG: shikimate dehydrogenase [Rhizobiaceae bacterium]|nr:shikimate dehydrogenase [Rhizobiaceae bacterium]